MNHLLWVLANRQVDSVGQGHERESTVLTSGAYVPYPGTTFAKKQISRLSDGESNGPTPEKSNIGTGLCKLPLPSPALIRKLVQSKQILTTSFIDEPEMQLQRMLINDWHIPENKISLKQAQSASWSPEVWFSHRWEAARRGDLIQENSLISQALPTCFTNYQCSQGLIKFSKWVLWCKLLLKNLIN